MSGDDLLRFGLHRRGFVLALLAASAATFGCNSEPPAAPPPAPPPPPGPSGVVVGEVLQGEDLFAYLKRVTGGFDLVKYKQLLGAANEYKEGDEAQGIAAADEASRANARKLLASTRLGDLHEQPPFTDELSAFVDSAVDPRAFETVRGWTMGELRQFLLAQPEPEIQAVMPGLPSDLIAYVVRLMSNDELVAVGSKVFNPLPGSKLGAKGYMGARIQPNSPTDDPDDIRWQVFDGWAYATGDVVLGTNPVSSEVASVSRIESALKDVLDTFGLADVMPHCCLSHIDVQAEVEKQQPGTSGLWFQSLGGTAGANATFDVSIDKMKRHAAARTGKYGLYFETGQGADATNGHGEGFDMVTHESRKYGFARALKQEVAEAQLGAGRPAAPWVHLNDVAGFIGPEIFRTREQLVRCCLEDIVMGKLHGLMLGLDICSTLHMEVSLDDLDWCIDQIMPANPGYLMGLPTKNDPMLSYLTTAYQDHVRIRSKFGYKVNDAMWAFFQRLGVIDEQGQPTKYFGQPRYVYAKYLQAKGDKRSIKKIMEAPETMEALAAVRRRGVFIAEGHGAQPWDLDPALDKQIHELYHDAKNSIFEELPPDFASTLPAALAVRTESKDRRDYILHPPTGEKLCAEAVGAIEGLRAAQAGKYNVQLVLSDGLNAWALTDEGHLPPFLETIRAELVQAGYQVAPEHIVCNAGRVRAGYHAGEVLFGALPTPDSQRAILHVIGERPGSGHHAYSVYMTAAKVSQWSEPGTVDHNITKVVSGIADTQLEPRLAARQTVEILQGMMRPA
jgi:ethanolamine ammonia-lyase large subunit